MTMSAVEGVCGVVKVIKVIRSAAINMSGGGGGL